MLAILLCALIAVPSSRAALRAQSKPPVERPPLYLPSIEYVRLVTLGYEGFAADILWFNTLNYFGKQFRDNKDYRWLGHMCDLVTSLDPKREHAYEFCAALLAWVSKEPEKSHELLSRAINHRPDYWRYYYLRGFTNWYFLEQLDRAKHDFERAARLPGAPKAIYSLAGRLMVAEDSPETAVAFLQDLIQNTTDKNVQKALRKQLKKAYLSRDVRQLKQALQRYEERFGMPAESWEELIDAQIITKLPIDPYGKPYTFDPRSGEVKPGSGKKGLEFFGKTARTGLAKSM